ncbi:MAG: FAD:protein FMN transferase [Planctomycetota bacterium]|nr:FAD:protein FMN transferase [Planctomycetota bacterium]
MGVEARIILYARDGEAARAAARAGFDRMERLEAVMSDYRPASELMRAGRAEPGEPVSISDDLFRVLARARAISQASDGAFDVTVGPLVRLWREARAEGRLPEPQAIEQARARVGWRAMTLDPQHRTLTLAGAGMQLDLGGIGKGFAADEALAALRRRGIDRCLIDLGGDLALGEGPPGRVGWRIAVRGGFAEEEPRLIELARAGVATSGDSRQFIELDGEHYSHIIDPRTGRGLTDRLAVTVIAPDAATADALASAISVLGEEDGLDLLDRFPCASGLIERWTPSGIEYRRTADFPAPAGSKIR